MPVQHISQYRSIHIQNDWWVWILMFVLPRRIWYRKHYLSSKHWRTFRRGIIVDNKGRCDKCNKHLMMFGGNLTFLDVHHLTYKRIWHEKPEDVRLLCRECHEDEHNEQ